jgi:hypothetical protein
LRSSIERKGAHSLRSMPASISTAPMPCVCSALANEPKVAKFERSSRSRVSFRKKKSPTTRISAPPSAFTMRSTSAWSSANACCTVSFSTG